MTLPVLTGHTRCIDLSASVVLLCVLLCAASSCYSFYVRSCCCVCRLRKNIRAEYMQGWFSCDVLSLLPYDLFSWLLEGSMQQEGSSVIKLLRVVRLLRLGKVSSFSVSVSLSQSLSLCKSLSANLKLKTKISHTHSRFSLCKSLYCVSIFTHSHTHTHALSLVLVVMIKSKELKTKTSLTHSLILSLQIKGTQDKDFSYSFSDSLSLCLSGFFFSDDSLSLILFACLYLRLYISMTLCLFASYPSCLCTNRSAWCRC